MKTNKIQWKRISEGEELPCDSLLMRYDGTITRGTCAGVKAGQDAYYLPIEELRTLPKEESEDERIRKELIGYFTGWSDKRLFRGFKAEQMLAWLETQGAHKKFLDSIQVGDKVTRNEDGVLVNLSQLNRVAKKDEKQGEQRSKLVDFDLNANDSDLQEETYFIPNGFHAEIISDKVVIKKGEQKHWSEDDEMKLNITIAYLLDVQDFKLNAKNCIDWLKSLKDRVQPKQEWSEEDNEHIKSIISTIECSKAQFPNSPAVLEAYNSDLIWLKSLRPQNSWKPSNEQMDVLLSEVGGWTKGCPKQIVLESLYNDLKKLMEDKV